MTSTFVTDCSRCRGRVRLNTAASRVVAGSTQVAAWTDGDLYYWDCPLCGHADSYWPDA